MKNLKQTIQNDLVRAVKEDDEITRSTLRMVLASLHNREIEKKSKLKKQSFDGTQDKPFDKVYPERNRRAQGKRKTEDEVIKEGELTDEEVTEVISSEIKKRKEAILEFSTFAEGYGGPAEARLSASEGGEKDKIDKDKMKNKIENTIKKEKAEIKILEKYLPEQLSEEELKKLAKEVIEKVGATEIKDMGKIMAELMPRVKGKADGGVVSKIVKELLSSKPH